MAQCKTKFEITAGFLARKSIRKLAYFTSCKYRNVKVEFKEFKSLLSSNFLVTLEGDGSEVAQARRYILDNCNEVM